MSRYMQHLACRFHPNAELIEDSRAGDMICPQCGMVVGERMIDVSTEWRTLTSETQSTDSSRVGAAQNLLYDNDNLETLALPGLKTGAMNASDKQKFNSRTTQISSKDKALRNAHDDIRAMAARINLPKRITNRAFLIFKHSYEHKYLRGQPQNVIVASCIHTACRLEGSPRAMREICGISSVTLKELHRVNSKIKQSLPTSTPLQAIEVKNLVPGFCHALELKQKMLIQKAAIHIAERANEVCDIQGRAPHSVAGASIYLACLAACENKTKDDIHQITSASEGVIRDVYRLMLPHAAELFPADFIFKCPLKDLPKS